MKATEWKLGASTCSTQNIDAETFRMYAEAEIFRMEISLPKDRYNEIDWKKTVQYSGEYGIELCSFHLPFSPFQKINLASLDRELTAHTLKYYESLLQSIGEAGIPLAVVHPSGEPNRDEDRPELMRIATDSLARLAEIGKKYGVTIAVENIPRSCLGNCSSEILQLISGNENLRICFDTNHLLTESCTDFLRACGEKIVHLHISDYDFRNERHWLPYEGKNNWNAILDGLEKANYSGVFLYEVPLQTPKTIRRRNLTLKDLKENYDACIHRTAPPLIGTPIESACAENAYFSIPVIK